MALALVPMAAVFAASLAASLADMRDELEAAHQVAGRGGTSGIQSRRGQRYSGRLAKKDLTLPAPSSVQEDTITVAKPNANTTEQVVIGPNGEVTYDGKPLPGQINYDQHPDDTDGDQWQQDRNEEVWMDVHRGPPGMQNMTQASENQHMPQDDEQMTPAEYNKYVHWIKNQHYHLTHGIKANTTRNKLLYKRQVSESMTRVRYQLLEAANQNAYTRQTLGAALESIPDEWPKLSRLLKVMDTIPEATDAGLMGDWHNRWRRTMQKTGMDLERAALMPEGGWKANYPEWRSNFAEVNNTYDALRVDPHDIYIAPDEAALIRMGGKMQAAEAVKAIKQGKTFAQYMVEVNPGDASLVEGLPKLRGTRTVEWSPTTQQWKAAGGTFTPEESAFIAAATENRRSSIGEAGLDYDTHVKEQSAGNKQMRADAKRLAKLTTEQVDDLITRMVDENVQTARMMTEGTHPKQISVAKKQQRLARLKAAPTLTKQAASGAFKTTRGALKGMGRHAAVRGAQVIDASTRVGANTVTSRLGGRLVTGGALAVAGGVLGNNLANQWVGPEGTDAQRDAVAGGVAGLVTDGGMAALIGGSRAAAAAPTVFRGVGSFFTQGIRSFIIAGPPGLVGGATGMMAGNAADKAVRDRFAADGVTDPWAVEMTANTVNGVTASSVGVASTIATAAAVDAVAGTGLMTVITGASLAEIAAMEAGAAVALLSNPFGWAVLAGLAIGGGIGIGMAASAQADLRPSPEQELAAHDAEYWHTHADERKRLAREALYSHDDDYWEEHNQRYELLQSGHSQDVYDAYHYDSGQQNINMDWTMSSAERERLSAGALRAHRLSLKTPAEQTFYTSPGYEVYRNVMGMAGVPVF